MQKDSLSRKIFIILNTCIMIGVVLVTVLPYMHVLAKALNDGNDTMRGGITFYPRKLSFTSFTTLFSDVSMIRAFFVSVARVVMTVALGVAVQFSAAYALTRQDLPGNKALNKFFAITMFVSGGTIPTYILFTKIGLINNFLVYVLPGLCSFYNIIIIKSYISNSIPNSIAEAATVDGANEIIILFRIILPLSLPVLATIALWIAVSSWNDWNTTLMFITKEKLYTLQYKLMQLVKESERLTKLIQEAATKGGSVDIAMSVKATPESLVSAQVIVTTLPIIIVYPFVQKYFISGITLGAVKS